MPRSSRTGELIFDPEVEKTERRTRKETRQLLEEHSSATSQRPEQEVEPTDSFGDTSSDSDQEEGTMANARTLRELAAPDLNQQPLCITFPTLNDNTPFELKSGLIHLLPSFHGLPGEEPYKHLQEFDVVCNSMKPPRITEEQIKMRAFPFSLKDFAKDWLYYLPPDSITMWNQLKKKFLDKYFSASRAASLRKEICGIKQHPGESLYEYWERYKKLCNKCSQHQISEQLLIQYFYDGLLFRDRSIIDATSGGALENKIPREARELIEGMTENSQQFGTREDVPLRKVNEAKVCGICTDMIHSTDMCPMMQEEGAELEKPKKQDKEKEILEVFRKVEVNIPLLDAIKQVSKYAKFLRDLCVNRKRLRGDERIIVGENVSAVLQRKLPPKCGDPGRFIVPCKIGNTLIRNTLLDLGTSINVMPKSMYTSLNFGPLKEIEIIIQLADRTNAYPDGLIEDVLVKVNELIFPDDFYVLDMDDDHSSDPLPLLLGRPFLSTAQTKIDVNKGTLSMEFDGELVHFNIFDTMEHPVNSHPVFAIHAINPSVQEFSSFACRNKFKFTENKYKGMEALYEVKNSRKLRKEAALKGYLDPGGGPPISRKTELHPD
ncbi:uncharacterized protein [Coffea arabica]|uniref:Retrotransposon gag domain-containing protein n=1 Tax=Coffea arabica TaxID=13443 RepID=A0ABM4WQ89_COFAR